MREYSPLRTVCVRFTSVIAIALAASASPWFHLEARTSDEIGWDEGKVRGLCGNEVAGSVAVLRDVPSADRPRLALIIGIDRYKDASIPATPGAEKDALLMKEVLVSNYGFRDDPSSIRVLTTEKATRSRIVSEFCGFLVAGARENASKRPIVVFYFSGHGTRYPNQSSDVDDSDSSDGFDEAIVPYDSRDPEVFDILDDELDDLSAELAEYSSDILFVFDSCHSGTVTRSDEIGREAPPDPRNANRAEYRRRFPPSDVDRRRAEKIVTLAAALPHEKAYPRSDLQNGAMTYELAAAMRRATSSTTYQDLMREVRSAVQSSGGGKQTPFADGDEMRPVLGEASKRVDGSFKITGGPDGGKIKIGAGSMHGVRTGAMVAVYSESATRLRGTEGFLSYASIESVSDRESVANLPKESENPAVREIGPRSRIVLASPTFGGGAIALVLDDPTTGSTAAGSSAVRTEIESQMRPDSNPIVQGGLLEVVPHSKLRSLSAKQRPSLVLTLKRGKFGAVFTDKSVLRLPSKCSADGTFFPPADADVYFLSSSSAGTGPGTAPLFGEYFRADDPSTPDRIVRAVSIYARQAALLNLENSVSALNDIVEVDVSDLSVFLDSACRDGSRKLVGWRCAAPSVQAASTRLRLGQGYKIRVRNTYVGPRAPELFAAVMVLTTDGKVQLLNRDSLTSPLRGTSPLEFSRLVTPPAGGETVKVIVTTNRNDLEGLRLLEGMTMRAGGQQSPLEKLLSRSGTRSGGDTSLAPSNPDSWGVKTLHISILSEKYACAKGDPLETAPR